MKTQKDFGKFLQIIPLVVLAISLLFLLFGKKQVVQATDGTMLPQKFIGEYRTEGGTWQPLNEQTKLSAYDGDLFLRGRMLYGMVADSRLNYFNNHIGVQMYVNDALHDNHILFELAERGIPLQPAVCGKGWEWIAVHEEISVNDTVEFHLRNPHKFGNRTAYQDFLQTITVGANSTEQLQSVLTQYNRAPIVVGAVLIIICIVLAGAALAAALLHAPIGKSLIQYALLALFAGGYIVMDASGLKWGRNVFFNTYCQHLCMMLGAYWLSLCGLALLTGRKRQIATWTLAASGVVDCTLILISFCGVTVIYNTLPVWVLSQLLVCTLLLGCMVLEWLSHDEMEGLLAGSYIVVFITVILDIFGVAKNIYIHAPLTKIALLLLFLVYFVRTAKIVIIDHQASIRAAQLEKELADNKISIMLSQIQPHFLYNVLGTIRGLCREDPEQARTALNVFSKYLRSNMNALTNKKAIHFSEELQHIEMYLQLESMRLGDRLKVQYDVEEQNFYVPPLIVQPMVENAVKHGIFHKEEGGTVQLQTRRTGETVEICICDDGIGFDPQAPLSNDEQSSHVGLQNVRSRLRSMGAGDLQVESTPGVGTKVRIVINPNWQRGEEDAYSGS